MQTLQDQVDIASAAYDQAQKTLRCARQDLEKRIFEHDMCVVEQKAQTLIDVTLQQIKDQEVVVEQASLANSVRRPDTFCPQFSST